MKHTKRIIGILLGILSLFILVPGVIWAWFLFSIHPLSHPLARYMPLPVACTTRGCVTSIGWHTQLEQSKVFSAQTDQKTPTSQEALTTAIRRHLVEHAFLRSPVTMADARRYREDILHITQQEQIQDLVPMTLDEYDRSIILPSLQQEALKQQHKVESTDELYATLSEQRTVFVLPWGLSWDTSSGSVR